jgi:prepilin-type N-terminal cleavage/methylation domain-containing protein
MSSRAHSARRSCAVHESAAGIGAAGFTLLELAVVMFIMGLMLTIAMPYLGGYRNAELKSQARRLAGRATYLYDLAAAQKVVYQLQFDLDANGYTVARLDPYAIAPVAAGMGAPGAVGAPGTAGGPAAPAPAFVPDNGPGKGPILLGDAVRIRDVSVEGVGTFTKGHVACQFYPAGYVDATVVHLVDASGRVMTLEFMPLTGQVVIGNGDLTNANFIGR